MNPLSVVDVFCFLVLDFGHVVYVESEGVGAFYGALEKLEFQRLVCWLLDKEFAEESVRLGGGEEVVDDGARCMCFDILRRVEMTGLAAFGKDSFS